MTFETQPIEARLVVSGQFECRDKDGVLLKVIDFQASIPLKETDNGNQRSE
jgi:hypothetical protein